MARARADSVMIRPTSHGNHATANAFRVSRTRGAHRARGPGNAEGEPWSSTEIGGGDWSTFGVERSGRAIGAHLAEHCRRNWIQTYRWVARVPPRMDLRTGHVHSASPVWWAFVMDIRPWHARRGGCGVPGVDAIRDPAVQVTGGCTTSSCPLRRSCHRSRTQRAQPSFGRRSPRDTVGPTRKQARRQRR